MGSWQPGRDVERVKVRDRDFNGQQGALIARYALRQSLVDLAASAELVAAELPAPAVERARAGRRAGWNVGGVNGRP